MWDLRFLAAVILCFSLPIAAQQYSVKTGFSAKGEATHTYQVSPSLFTSARKAWTVELKVENLMRSDGGPLLAISDSAGQPRIEAHIAGSAGSASVQVLFRTDFRSEPLVLNLPIESIDASGSHTLMLRYEGFRLSFICDGVLVDEEWPMGTVMSGGAASVRVSPPVAQLAIWNTALSDKVISGRNGGAVAIAARSDRMMGKESSGGQYSRPRGFDTNAGDAMPFYHDGAFHLFYLLDRRQHHSKWGLGAHQWGHISSTDLVHWRRDPTALAVDHEWEGSICTGSVYFHSGRYYAFYATRMPDRSERLAVAESSDGIHFTKSLPTPFAEPTRPFLHGTNRDPFIFRDGSTFHMLVTAAIPSKDSEKGEGVLEQLVSHDLKAWTILPEPFLKTGSPSQPECSTWFHWHGWYYLLFGIDGTTHYRISRSPEGPWITPDVDVLDSSEAVVMKAATFTGDRWLLVGFVPHDHRYGGNLAFRELIQEGDGLLGTKLPAEMLPPGAPVNTAETLHLDGNHPESPLPEVGSRLRLSAVLHPSQGSSAFGIKIASEGATAETLTIDPALHRVAWIDAEGKSTRAILNGVDDLETPVRIDMVLEGNLIDLCIDGKRTMIHRLPTLQQPRLIFFTQRSTLNISNVAVSTIP